MILDNKINLSVKHTILEYTDLNITSVKLKNYLNAANTVHKILFWFTILSLGGRCAVITFHSLEDRIVKRTFHGINMEDKFNLSATNQIRNSSKIHSQEVVETFFEKKWEPLTKKVVTQNFEHNKDNPRGRSAKLRGAVKL